MRSIANVVSGVLANTLIPLSTRKKKTIDLSRYVPTAYIMESMSFMGQESDFQACVQVQILLVASWRTR
jgi:hypothetical protein